MKSAKRVIIIAALVALLVILIGLICRECSKQSENKKVDLLKKWSAISDQLFSEKVRLGEIPLNGEKLIGVTFADPGLYGNQFFSFWIEESRREVIVEVQGEYIISVSFTDDKPDGK